MSTTETVANQVLNRSDSLVYLVIDGRCFGQTRTVSPREKVGTTRLATGNMELMYECFPKYSCMGMARMK